MDSWDNNTFLKQLASCLTKRSHKMIVDMEKADNPYLSPQTPETPPGRSRFVRWLLFGIAIILVLLSLPFAWLTLELANQENLHIWNSSGFIHYIEINGTPVSNAAAMCNGVTVVLIKWSLAAALIVIPRFFARKTTAQTTAQ